MFVSAEEFWPSRHVFDEGGGTSVETAVALPREELESILGLLPEP